MTTDRPIPEFSPREKQLLEFAAAGLTDTAIANKLGISEATVGTYWGRVRIKLGPHSRTELVAMVLRAQSEAALDALRRENEQLVQELQKLVATSGQDRQWAIIDDAPDAIVLVAEAGTLQHVNQAATELFGYSREEMIGMDLVDLVPPRYRDVHRLHRQDYVSHPERRQMGAHLQTPAYHKNGHEFLVRASLSATDTPEGMLVICTIRAIDI